MDENKYLRMILKHITTGTLWLQFGHEVNRADDDAKNCTSNITETVHHALPVTAFALNRSASLFSARLALVPLTAMAADAIHQVRKNRVSNLVTADPNSKARRVQARSGLNTVRDSRPAAMVLTR
jgi:hypothetical protein